jgi:hypothetical protein
MTARAAIAAPIIGYLFVYGAAPAFFIVQKKWGR